MCVRACYGLSGWRRTGRQSSLGSANDPSGFSSEAILAKVMRVVADWSQHADAAGFSEKSSKLLGDQVAPTVLK